MKTKPYQLRGNAFDTPGEAEFTTHPLAISAQKPKEANLRGPLRNTVAPLGFCFKNKDSLSVAFLPPTATPVFDLKTKGAQVLTSFDDHL